ncbi:hypothetical protein L1887_10000 [Cichorium endivia]|nr:hypothetical protein L1887_10000 [Cichorium endivia]
MFIYGLRNTFFRWKYLRYLWQGFGYSFILTSRLFPFYQELSNGFICKDLVLNVLRSKSMGLGLNVLGSKPMVPGNVYQYYTSSEKVEGRRW